MIEDSKRSFNCLILTCFSGDADLFILKNIFIFVSVIVMLLLFMSGLMTVKKQSRAASVIRIFQFLSFVMIFSFVFTLFVKDDERIILVAFFYEIYLFSIIVLLYSLLYCIFMIEEKLGRKKRMNSLLTFFLIWGFLDTLLLFFNFILLVCKNLYFGLSGKSGLFTSFIAALMKIKPFSLQPYFYKDSFFCWILTPSLLLYIHYLYCAAITVAISVKLILELVKVSRLYRGKYIIILSLLETALIINLIYIFNSSLVKLDYSVFVFGFSVLFVFLSLEFLIPKYIQKNMLSVASENISDAVICFDNEDNIIYKNKKAGSYNFEAKKDFFNSYLKTVEENIQKTEVISFGAKKYVFKVEFRRIRDKKGKYSGSYFRITDCTNEIKAMRKEEYRATHDELTGLYNRKFFFSEMERILKKDPDTPRYLVCTNIKNFKMLNDLFGTAYGDSILKKQAQMLKRAKYDDVIYGRITGDKFAMLIQKENFKPELAVKNTEFIRELNNEINYQFNVYIGVYEIANPYENVHTMYDKANMAIKNIKTECGTTIAMYDTALMKKLILEKNIISEFKSALAEEQFCIFLQPQIQAKTGKCIGAEALARWRYFNGIYRNPHEFVEILEETGLIYQLDFYIWEKAVQRLSEWNKKGYKLFISVNISVKDFYYEDLYKYLVGLVEKYDVPPSLLNLEITESVLIDDSRFFMDIISRLKKYGFRIEMDDFGSGYSSLNALKNLTVDVLKIDMEFLQKAKNEEKSKIIVSSVVRMAKSLGMTVVTEGVETEAHVKFLSDLGVDIFQGYYYSKPLYIDDFEEKYLTEDILANENDSQNGLLEESR